MCEFGRSMIEMLGVLAIVGVLSIGGISAFQTAMAKHRNNQITEDFSGFINEVLRYSGEWKKEIPGERNGEYKEITSKLDFLLPTRWYRKGASIYDNQGNQIVVIVRTKMGTRKSVSFRYTLTGMTGEARVNLCTAFFKMAKMYAGEIYLIDTYQEETSGNTAASAYGNTYCGGKNKCISDLTLAEINENCSPYRRKSRYSSMSMHFHL
ncbi:MAG: type II secretion system protein [Alphaproteobacteria bacterium]|nr:type II secretion system protein [Alphaproteobacteria bacterium]